MSNYVKHDVIVGFDSCGNEAQEFVAWLNSQGHTARVGDSTGSYIDGRWTSSDEEANQIMSRLWDEYCTSDLDEPQVEVRQQGPFWSVGIINHKGRFAAFWRGFESEADARAAMIDRADEFAMRLRAAMANNAVSAHGDEEAPDELLEAAEAANKIVREFDAQVPLRGVL